jgi:hypothetical protein
MTASLIGHQINAQEKFEFPPPAARTNTKIAAKSGF